MASYSLRRACWMLAVEVVRTLGVALACSGWLGRGAGRAMRRAGS
jgi:hypothetical protein